MSTACGPVFAPGSGGIEQYPPASATAGEPTVVKVIVGVAGAGGPIKGHYQNLTLHYRLTGSATYHSSHASPIPLPQNYQQAASKLNKWEAYEFTIPPYPKETEGQIEYTIDLTVDGISNHVDGYKTIPLSTSALH